MKGGGGGGGGNWTRISMLSDRRNTFSILMFGLIFTSCIRPFTQWHWIEYLNIIDVMVWFSLAAITWAEGNQYFTCCYEATMNSSASVWSVLWNGGKGGVQWVNWLLFVSTYEDLSTQWGWVKMACSRPYSFFQELIFVISLYWILFQTNETALVKVMTWHITGSKTLREPVITQFTDPCTCMLHFASCHINDMCITGT